jgi:putative transposase
MPRRPRIDQPGLIYHVMCRGARQLALFHDDQDRQMYLQFLLYTRDRFAFKLHAYSLMTNHIHLLLQSIGTSLGKIMQLQNRQFSAWLNLKYTRMGHSFQGRFHSIPVEENRYFKVVARYIHLNAVRAGIVERPEEYPWTDYGKLIRGERDPVVDSRFLLDYFGETPREQVEAYQRFVEDDRLKPEPVSQAALYRLRAWGSPPAAAVGKKRK